MALPAARRDSRLGLNGLSEKLFFLCRRLPSLPRDRRRRNGSFLFPEPVLVLSPVVPPCGDDTAPLASPGDNLASPGDDLASPGDSLASPGDNLTSPGDNLSSLGNNLSPPGDNFSLGGEEDTEVVVVEAGAERPL